MHILIAEDDFTSRAMLAVVLKKAGHEVLETTDGAEALEFLQKPDAPRLAILDWMMPQMDGLTVLRKIRVGITDKPHYIIMLTTKGEKSDIIAGLDAGANDYLLKPFNAGELIARVEVGRRMIDIQDALAKKVEELHQALTEIKTLRGILPICASCKKIRDDKGYWNQLEVYVRDRTEAEFSHSICPDCMQKLYPEFEKTKDN